ncbi:hypothetical protein DL93DRAFT_388765 [Clavulina sp. PMI_390]|nr:hypothetical protein DL93DRAFT_388765 [Clavulina sp. PMI_390]
MVGDMEGKKVDEGQCMWRGCWPQVGGEGPLGRGRSGHVEGAAAQRRPEYLMGCGGRRADDLCGCGGVDDSGGPTCGPRALDKPRCEEGGELVSIGCPQRSTVGYYGEDKGKSGGWREEEREVVEVGGSGEEMERGKEAKAKMWGSSYTVTCVHTRSTAMAQRGGLASEEHTSGQARRSTARWGVMDDDGPGVTSDHTHSTAQRASGPNMGI